MVVAILDSGAKLMLLHAMKDSYIASVQIAQDKAYTAVALKMPFSYSPLKESRGGALDGLTPTDNNKLLLLGGGMPFYNKGTYSRSVSAFRAVLPRKIRTFPNSGAMYLERRLEL